MTQISESSQRVHDSNMEHFCIRRTARLCILLICLFSIFPRLISLSIDSSIPKIARLIAFIGLPFPLLIGLVIILEYFFYKKFGPDIVKYSGKVDIMLLVFFTADWIAIATSVLTDVEQTYPVSFKLGTLFGFTTFSWRTLMVTLIVQKWKLKIIPPIIVLGVTAGYAIYYVPSHLSRTLFAVGYQLFNIILILYCEDKIKWKLMWANIQKEKCLEVSDFILNSIPENIMILDMKRETKFISEHCKSFMKKCDLSFETKDFFKKIQDLKQQQCESQNLSSSVRIESLTTGDESFDHNRDYNYLEELIVNFNHLIKNKEIYERQFLIYNGKLKTENYQERSLEVKISFIQHFEESYIILILRDTTQRDLLVTLEEANKYKDKLLASVSHELRAPLNGTINMVEGAVHSKYVSQHIKETLLIPALRSSIFLLHIINDVLDMSQIKEKKLRLAFQSASLTETLKNTTQLVEIQAKKKGIELNVELDPALPTKFYTDHIRLSQIVLNLLSNSVKFTKKGTIKLTVKAMLEPNLIKIIVEDSGIGMNQENLQKLFTTFTHIEFETRQDMNPTGVGLGLNIAHNLALLLGPKDHYGITAKSSPGQGSTFTFVLENQPEKLEYCSDDLDEIPDESSGQLVQFMPFSELQGSRNNLDMTAALMGEAESFSLLNNSCFCPKILIVDDNPFNTMAFETILSSLEVKCESVYSGSSCLEKLVHRESTFCGENCKQYAMVFTDQEMPEMTGSETTLEIKRLQERNLLSKSIKVIGCTAHKSKEEVDKFMQSGISQCIHKPISTTMIKNILKGTV